MDLYSCLSFSSRSETRYQKFAALCLKFIKNYYSDRGESTEESTMNAVRKVRFWLKKIVCAINKQNSTGILCRTQNLINKRNFSRQSNNKFRDRPHMIYL